MSAVDLARLVKPLKFADETGDVVLTSRETGSLFRVFPQNDGMFFAPRLGMDDGVSSDPQALIDCINKHHAARVISALDADLLAELVEALVLADQSSRDLGWHRIYDATGPVLAKLGVQP